MESTGEPLKIHISKECNAELTKLGGFVTGTYLKYYSKAKLFQEDCFSESFYLPEVNTQVQNGHLVPFKIWPLNKNDH